MASRYIFTASERPSNPADFTGAASGGTITGSSGTMEIVIDDSVFTATMEGKQRFIAALDALKAKVQSTKVWPITSAS